MAAVAPGVVFAAILVVPVPRLAELRRTDLVCDVRPRWVVVAFVGEQQLDLAWCAGDRGHAVVRRFHLKLVEANSQSHAVRRCGEVRYGPAPGPNDGRDILGRLGASFGAAQHVRDFVERGGVLLVLVELVFVVTGQAARAVANEGVGLGHVAGCTHNPVAGVLLTH